MGNSVVSKSTESDTSEDVKEIDLSCGREIKTVEECEEPAESEDSTKNVRAGEILQERATEKKIKMDGKNPQEGNPVEEDSSGIFLTFHVKCKDQVEIIILPFEETLDKLQERISSLFGVLPSSQIFHGCGLHGNTSEEILDKRLSSLKLSSPNYLTVEEVMELKLLINIVEKPSERKISLNLSDIMRVHELKQYVYCIWNIPVRYQDWSNGLNDQKDEATLRQAKLKGYDEVLTVRSREYPSRNSFDSASSDKQSHSSSDEKSDSDSDSGSIFLNRHFPMTSASSPPLIDGCISFSYKYKMRFGYPTPEFHTGDFSSALTKAYYSPDKKKLLAIYMHHDDSILTNIFCYNVLKNEKILNLLRSMFIVYGVDLTSTEKASSFFGQLKERISLEASNTAEKIELDKLPAFMLVGEDIDVTHTVISVIHGDIGVDELEHKLLEQYELLINLSSSILDATYEICSRDDNIQDTFH